MTKEKLNYSFINTCAPVIKGLTIANTITGKKGTYNYLLNVLDNTTIRDSHNIVGSGATTVTSDANGKITISSTNTVYTHPTTHPASMITGLATVATSGSYNDLSDKPTIPAAYSLPDATTSVKGGVKIGSNLTVSSGTISLTKANVVAALGYTPPTQDTNTDTKVTNTLDKTTKAYVTGTTSATTNTGTQVFDTGVYLDTTAGTLVAKRFKTWTGIEIY